MAGDGEHVDTEANSENGEKIVTKIVNRSVLDNFTLLTKIHVQQRKKGGLLLIKHLQNSEKREDGQNEFKYALERLVRGLGSPKIAARAGFFASLMAILTKIVKSDHQEIVNQFFELIKKHLATGKSNSKSENADIVSGQILAYGALIKSRVFFLATSEQQQEILTNIIEAGKKRAYLGLVAYTFIGDMFDHADDTQFKKIILPALKPEICKPLEEHTSDSLYLLFLAAEKYPSVFSAKFLTKNIGHSTLLNEESVKIFGSLLLGKPTLIMNHPIVETISKKIATSEYISHFYSHLDEIISKPNYNKHLMFAMVTKIILENIVEYSGIPEIFQTNFVRHTLTYFRDRPKKNEELHQKLHKLFETVVLTLKNDKIDSEIKLNVIKKLLFDPGTFNFEQITKLKVVQQITSSLDETGVKNLAQIYADVITERYEDYGERFQNLDKLYAAQMLARILGHPVLQNDWDFKAEKLKFFMDISFTETNDYCKVGSELASHLKATFFRALDLKAPKLENMRNLFKQLLLHINAIIKDNLVLRTKLTEKEMEIFEKTNNIVDKLDTKLESKKKKRNLYLVFQILFLHLSLHLFNDPKLALDSLEELCLCYERVKGKKSNDNEENQGSDDPEWIEVVLDLFLNLLSHNSHLLRSLINSVFPHLVGHVNLNSLHHVLSVLDPDNDSILQKKNVKSEEDTNSNEDEDKEGEEAEKDDEDESDSSDEDIEDEEDFDGDETVNDRLRQALREALGGTGYQTDEESVDIDNLSDTEAEKMDTALGKAFKEFKPNLGQRKKQSKTEETLTHFRLRALDLIEIYIESNPHLLLCLEIMIPLLKTLEFSVREKHQEPLQERVKTLLGKLSNVKKFCSFEGVDEKYLAKFVKNIVDRPDMTPGIAQELDGSISNCNKFILRASQFLTSQENFEGSGKLKKKLVKYYSEHIEDFFTKRDSLVPFVLLKELFSYNWSGNLKLYPKICQTCFHTEVKIFKRNQALTLLKLFLSNSRLLSQFNGDENGKSEFLTTSADLCKVAAEFLENPQDEKWQANEKFVANLFQVLATLKKGPIQTDAEIWSSIKENLKNYTPAKKLSKDALVALKMLTKTLGMPNLNLKQTNGIAPKKSNLENGTNSSDQEPKQSKRKNKLETQKLRKKARLERMKANSEGLSSSFSFTGANLLESNLTELENDETLKAEESPSGKAQKKRKVHEEPTEIIEENLKETKKKKKKT